MRGIARGLASTGEGFLLLLLVYAWPTLSHLWFSVKIAAYATGLTTTP
jgi:hypothetical protein